MASIRSVVKSECDTITDGIAWLVLYKEGRSWKSDYFYCKDGSYDEGYIFEKEDIEEMRKIFQKDYKAICINGYYMGFGEDFTHKEIEDRLIWMYTERLNQLSNFIESYIDTE